MKLCYVGKIGTTEVWRKLEPGCKVKNLVQSYPMLAVDRQHTPIITLNDGDKNESSKR